jgi:hypothetical protein
MAPLVVLGVGRGEQRQERPHQVPEEFPDPRGGRVFSKGFEQLLEGFGHARVFRLEGGGALASVGVETGHGFDEPVGKPSLLSLVSY